MFEARYVTVKGTHMIMYRHPLARDIHGKLRLVIPRRLYTTDESVAKLLASNLTNLLNNYALHSIKMRGSAEILYGKQVADEFYRHIRNTECQYEETATVQMNEWRHLFVTKLKDDILNNGDKESILRRIDILVNL